MTKDSTSSKRSSSASSAASFSFPVPEESYSVLLDGDAVCRMSKPMETILNQSAQDADSIIKVLSRQEDGSEPFMLDGRVWISTSVSAGNQHLIIFKDTSRVELEEWLELHQSSKPCMMVNGSGKIFAVNQQANELFKGFKLQGIGDFLDQISSTAFLTAANNCLSGKEIRDFSVLSTKGEASRKSQVISLRRVGLTDELMTITFSPPSMAMRTLEQDATKFARNLFNSIPLPTVRINEKTQVMELNGQAGNLFDGLGLDVNEESALLDFIVPEDRERVASLYRNRFEGLTAPFQFRAGIRSVKGEDHQFQMTSLLTPGRESFMLFMFPVSRRDVTDSESVSDQLLGGLLKILGNADETEGRTRMILEFLRTGTGAKGAAYISRTRKIAVGETSLPQSGSQFKTPNEPVWTEESGGYCVSIPVKQQHDQAVLRISGIPSRRSDPVSRLVIGLAPILAGHVQSTQYLDSIVGLLNSISSFMTLIQGRERDIRMMLNEISNIVAADYSVIHTISSREPVLKQLVSTGATTEPGALRIEIPSISSWAYTHTELCYVPDTAVDQRFSSIFPSSRSEMAIPLVEGGKTMGTLTVGCTRRDAFGYPVGSMLGVLGTTLSLWLFRDNRGIRNEGGGGKKERSELIPGLEDLLLGLSHQLRAPVTSILGNADLLSSEKLGPLTDEQKGSLEEMSRALMDLTEYTGRILNFMKIELGQDILDSSWARPSDVVSSMLPVFKEKARARGITITTQLPQEPFTASFDRSRLEQIFSNLVNNALDFNRKDGSVGIEIRLDGSSHWILEVFNTGNGISREDLPNVFDRFYVGDSGRSAGGLGIGLTIVKGFAQHMGGSVSVRSRQGQGTWFTVRLPIS